MKKKHNIIWLIPPPILTIINAGIAWQLTVGFNEPVWVTIPLFLALSVVVCLPFFILYENPEVIV